MPANENITFAAQKVNIPMANNFIEELKWRGMIHDAMPGTDEQLNQSQTAGYVGIDPTADSLHIGHLVSVMMLKHLQRHGHKPIALVGGATGMIGDPSGKSKERNLLSEEELRHNQAALKNQLSQFLDFDAQEANAAVVVNNYDWMSNFSFLDFIRDVGKHITVNYMMSKDSVKKRLGSESVEGMSFTEFTYQLVQGYDFLHLFRTMDCKLQMGGSDQWGNITTGTELIRRVAGGKAYALTCPLITKADGSKFGKTEEGNIWLDKNRTSPYKFHQFWLNTADEDAEKYIKIFTVLSREEIDSLIAEHRENPGRRLLQNKLAEEVTIAVHGQEELETAVAAGKILFGKGTEEALRNLSEEDFLSVFEGVPQATMSKNDIVGTDTVNLFAAATGFLKSNGEVRRALKENSLQINKSKVKSEDFTVEEAHLINGKYLLLQRGKKNYFLVVVK